MGDTYPLEQALLAQRALREAAGQVPERIPLPAIVDIMSREISQLRAQGFSYEQIAAIIRDSSNICVSAADIGPVEVPKLRRRR